MEDTFLMRYRRGGLVDLGCRLGAISPIVLRDGDRLDLLLGTDLWQMGGRDDTGLSHYVQPQEIDLPASAGRGIALWEYEDGSPRELWAIGIGQIQRFRVEYKKNWRFTPVGEAEFPAPKASKGLGTVQLIPAPDGRFPSLLIGDNDWRQEKPIPEEWSPDLPFPEDMAVRYKGGAWQGRTVEGRVYIARNTGIHAPDYRQLELIRADGEPIRVHGRASPVWLVPFMDGIPRLIVGDFQGNVFDFPAFGETEDGPDIQPLLEGRLRAAGRLAAGTDPLFLYGCIPNMTCFDTTGNGYPDLTFVLEDGYVYVAQNDGKGFSQPRRLQQERSIIKAGVLAVPTPVRNESGKVDLYCGTASGEIMHLKNTSRSDEPDFESPYAIQTSGRPYRLLAGLDGSAQGPEELKWGYVGPAGVDWTGNGIPDLIVGCILGSYWLIRGKSTSAGLAWETPVRMTVAGEPLMVMWRVRPSAADWDNDGEPEILTLDEDGCLALYKRNPAVGSADLLLPERVVDSRGQPLYIGGPNLFPGFTMAGRSKLFAYDWDQDGRLELLVGTHCRLRPHNPKLGERATVMLIDNVGTPEKPVWGQIYAVELKGGRPLDFGVHSCAPIMVDWKGDGHDTMIVGTEDGFFYQFPKDELELSTDIVPPYTDKTGGSERS